MKQIVLLVLLLCFGLLNVNSKFQHKSRFQHKQRIQKKSILRLKNQSHANTNKDQLFVISKSDVIEQKDTDLVKASPDVVEEELEDRINNADIFEVNPMHKTKWDLREAGFNCNNDLMKGELFMIEKVSDVNSTLGALIKGVGLSNIQKNIQLIKVSIVMNSQKLIINDNEDQIKEIIQLNNVYPKQQTIEQILAVADDGQDSDQTQKRESVEKIKLRLLNGSQIINTVDGQMNGFFCLSLINERTQSDQRQNLYQSNIISDVSSNDEIKKVLDYLYSNDQEHSSEKNVHNHEYFSVLTLCHSDEKYVKKWVSYVNREKVDCLAEYNREVATGDAQKEETESIMNEGSTNDAAVQLMKKEQQREEESKRLEEQKKEQLKKSKLTQEEIDKQELERLTNELGDLNSSMDQEQEYSQKEIAGLMNNIQSMQKGVSDKGEQLQCLEQALQIRQEEENTQVISLLKDEEMAKTKSVITNAKKSMKEAYQKRIEELKKSLNQQKDSIDQQKGGYDQLMINIIKQGLKSGTKSKCVAVKNTLMKTEKELDTAKLNDFIENACTFILNENENSNEVDSGILDEINKCTKKELFCNKCCDHEFGDDQLVYRTDCFSDCQSILDLALQGKTTYTIGITNVVSPAEQLKMTEKVMDEIEIKKSLATKRRR